jgi:hypothetical protein
MHAPGRRRQENVSTRFRPAGDGEGLEFQGNKLARQHLKLGCFSVVSDRHAANNGGSCELPVKVTVRHFEPRPVSRGRGKR